MGFPDKKIYIIGQGIAGSVLAFLLDRKEYHVCITDDSYQSSSSIVAAGMWNPVSFKRMSRSWRVDLLLPAAEAVYREMETVLQTQFYHPLDLVKIFPDNAAANAWDEKSIHPELSEYLSPEQDDEVREKIFQPFGHGVVRHAGWLDIPKMLNAVRQYFLEKNRLYTSSFSAEDEQRILSEEKNAHIIYCTGWKNAPGFSDWIKIIPNKGEVLTIETGELQLSRMVNFGKFLIPIGGNRFRLGATYKLFQPDISPTEEAKNEILQQLANHYQRPVEVVNHLAGYRPTTPDRNPVIGEHPDNSRVSLFNGFGSKGVMLIPFFARHYIDHFLNGTPLMKEADHLRFRK